MKFSPALLECQSINSMIFLRIKYGYHPKRLKEHLHLKLQSLANKVEDKVSCNEFQQNITNQTFLFQLNKLLLKLMLKSKKEKKKNQIKT